MSQQTEITDKMRRILVDWLVDVAVDYQLCRETLFLCVNYIDRFLSVVSIRKVHLQLAGAAALFVAS